MSLALVKGPARVQLVAAVEKVAGAETFEGLIAEVNNWPYCCR